MRPDDPVLWGGQRAQIFASDAVLQQHNEPPLTPARGEHAWYAFAFRTNNGYRPQRALPFPNWNTIFTWHDSGYACGAGHCSAPQANVAVGIATAYGHNGRWSYFARPRISIEVYGGDPHDAKWWAHGHRWYTTPFVAGRTYVVQMGITWGEANTGSIEVWINGRRAVRRTAVTNLWAGMNVYPVFENYRQPSVATHPSVTWTNTVYYAGFVRGARRADVRLRVG